MILIRHTGRRDAQRGKDKKVYTGIFHCTFCGEDVELSVATGKRRNDCGCQSRSIRLATIYRPSPKERTCLMCGKKFMSRGPHNRRCGLCEQRLAQDGQADYMPPVYKQNDHSVVAECWET